MNRLLIVGCGFLGEAIAVCFRIHGWEVICVARTAQEGGEVADVSDVESLRGLRQRVGAVSHVVHCASSGRGGIDSYHAVYEQGASNLVKVFGDAFLLMTSSSSVYAQVAGELVDESSETIPDRETGQCLLRSEQIALAANGTVMRLSGIYGEGRSIILKRWLAGVSRVEADGRRMLNQIHRYDAAEAFYLVATQQRRGEIFNVSEPKPKSQLETLQWLADHYGQPLPESEPIDMNRKRAWTDKTVSSTKLQQLGWKPKFNTFTDAVDVLEPTL